MPNTLLHLCIQTPASRLLIRDADFKWIAVGCIIPDIPWILQRIITLVLPGIVLIDLRIYAVIQASLFFCLLLSLAASLLTIRPASIFLLLSFNAFVHLFLDSLQTKWANGVHFFAPLSWEVTSFSSIWPEHALIYFLSILGLGVLIICGARDWKKTVRVNPNGLRRSAAVLLVIAYFLFPFLLLQGPELENNHYAATLRSGEDRTGKYIEFDRGVFRGSDKTIRVFSGERLKLQGNVPRQDALLSIQGYFVDRNNIRVTAFHVHSSIRDISSMTGLAGVMLIWLFAIARKKSTLKATPLK